MKTIKLVSLLILVIASVLSGCESDVNDLDSFESKSKLVVLSYISPQDTKLVVRLQKTQPAIGRKLTMEELKVKNASVTISDEKSVVVLTYNPDSDCYEANAREWPVVEGKTYRLKVEAPGHKAEAFCTIPLTTGIRITNVEAPYTTVKDYGGYDVRRYNIYYKWQDAPNVQNYYSTFLYVEQVMPGPNGTEQPSIAQLYINNELKRLQKDEKMPGGILTSEVSRYDLYSDSPQIKRLHALLVVSDKHYYMYHMSLFQQQQSTDNPFAEPNAVYTNITGGLGVFAGYNQVVKVKEME